MLERGILFKRGGRLTIEVHADAHYVSSITTKRRVIKLLYVFGGNMFTWRNKKQIIACGLVNQQYCVPRH